MKLAHKLLLAPVLTAAVLLGIAQLNAFLNTRQATATQTVFAGQIGVFKALSAAQQRLAQTHADVYRTVALVASLDDAQVKSRRADLAQRMADIKLALQSLSRGGADADLVKIASDAALLINRYVKEADGAIDMATVDPNTGVAAMQTADVVYAGLYSSMAQVVAHIETQARNAADTAATQARRLNGALAAAGLLLAGAMIVAAHMMQRRLVADIHTAREVAGAVAQGRLNQTVATLRRDELGDLLRALGSMQGQLRQVVSGVRASAEQISAASGQVASGNADLSQRTEQQAAALQQTAASMHQLDAIAKQNTAHASQADTLAHGAADVATKGGAVVGKVVATMRHIHASSQQIADIVGVIDGIAFQTNLLALNAAVEAAKAGPQGRGFAVVAGEVRALAGRSATAAREIKRLIQTSAERVEAGSAQVIEAGATMAEVVAQVGRVTRIVRDITHASQEQHAGVANVSTAVSRMDQSTRQNAALVEQSAAAAEDLNRQAQRLMGAVAVFELG
jgi:methyl-accepting chemotaxis protein